MEAGESKGVIFVAFACNLGIAIAKFLAAAWTQSSAMLSEAIHSVVDTSNQLLLLLGINRAKLPPDAQHPFGHGKEIYFWSFIVAMVLFSLGAGSSAKRHPVPFKPAYAKSSKRKRASANRSVRSTKFGRCTLHPRTSW
ncbi:cation transporter [Hyphomicrobium sp.]|uniref:cation diffusion facilitator family transporter n=1 Tax=Hyphomicrobium sp. TaxID=82 RepID=UPI0025BB744B|nr:cation transporter [Hyphomicrobium sp.]